MGMAEQGKSLPVANLKITERNLVKAMSLDVIL